MFGSKRKPRNETTKLVVEQIKDTSDHIATLKKLIVMIKENTELLKENRELKGRVSNLEREALKKDVGCKR